jgi:hypothetical protein
VAQVGVAVEAHVGALEAAGALHPNVTRAVDHDLVDVAVREQRLQGTEPRGQPHDALGQRDAVGLRQRGRLARDELADLAVDVLLPRSAVAGAFDQPAPQRVGELVESIHADLSANAHEVRPPST